MPLDLLKAFPKAFLKVLSKDVPKECYQLSVI